MKGSGAVLRCVHQQVDVVYNPHHTHGMFFIDLYARGGSSPVVPPRSKCVPLLFHPPALSSRTQSPPPPRREGGWSLKKDPLFVTSFTILLTKVSKREYLVLDTQFSGNEARTRRAPQIQPYANEITVGRQPGA